MREPHAQRPSGQLRRFARNLGLIAAVLVLILVAFQFLWPPGLVSGAGACEEVSSSACHQFVEVLYGRPDVRTDEIRSIKGVTPCGSWLCQQSFGGTIVRLQIAYDDDSTATFRCSQMTFGDPSCEPI